MQVRLGFVSNSSSTSFVIFNLTLSQVNSIIQRIFKQFKHDRKIAYQQVKSNKLDRFAIENMGWNFEEKVTDLDGVLQVKQITDKNVIQLRDEWGYANSQLNVGDILIHSVICNSIPEKLVDRIEQELNTDANHLN
jgi:hypothetical protein